MVVFLRVLLVDYSLLVRSSIIRVVLGVLHRARRSQLSPLEPHSEGPRWVRLEWPSSERSHRYPVQSFKTRLLPIRPDACQTGLAALVPVSREPSFEDNSFIGFAVSGWDNRYIVIYAYYVHYVQTGR